MKSRNANIFLLLVILLFFIFGISSCKKHKNIITINGHIYDPYSGLYVSSADVTISSCTINSGFYNSNYTDIATTSTDANGAFSFEFEQEKSSGYRFYIYKDHYFDNTIDIPESNIQPENIYAPTFEIYPSAYIKLHVKNNSPYDDNDFIAYSYDVGNAGCIDCCTNTVLKGYGKTYDSTYKCKTFGSKDVLINWHVTKWSIDMAYSDTVYCTPFDTTYYEILY